MTPAEDSEHWNQRGCSSRYAASAEVPGTFWDEALDFGLERLREFGSLLMPYKFAVDEIVNGLRIWSEEFDFANQHDPIEHITHRVKTPEAIVAKLRRRSLPVTPDSAKENLEDIAGVRAVCPFVSDVYLVRDLLLRLPVEITKTKDYIAEPKPNGYRSLHLTVRIPVHLSEHTMHVTAELQLRTIAMDFWAALEHELSYKGGDRENAEFNDELKSAANTVADLDARMESLYQRSVSRGF